MLRLSTVLRAKSNTGWFPCFFHPRSPQVRLHFSTPHLHQLLLCLFTPVPLTPPLYTSVSSVPNTVLSQGALGHSGAESGVMLVQMYLPASALVSSTREGEGRKRREGEKQKSERGEQNFFLNGSLLDCGCVAVPPAWVSPGEKRCGSSADGFLPTFSCLTVIIGTNPTSCTALAMCCE